MFLLVVRIVPALANLPSLSVPSRSAHVATAWVRPIAAQVHMSIYGCRYDALIVDLYTGDNPLEMLTAEALGRLKREWFKVLVRVRVGVRGC